MKLTYLGHSCLQVDVQSSGPPVRLVIDPGVFSGDLPATADAVLLTHAHADHVSPELVADLAVSGARVIGDAAALDVLRAAEEFPRSVEFEAFGAGQSTSVGDVEIEGVGGLHAVIHADLDRATNVGLLVRAGGVTLFHPGDSYEYTPSGVDVLAVPVAAPWGALKEAVDFVRAVRPGRTVPIHDKILAPGARGMFTGRVEALGGAPMHDIVTDGPLEL